MQPSLALVRFGAAGDVAMCNQAIDAAAAADLGLRLIFVTQSRYAPLVAGHPHIAKTLGLSQKVGLQNLSRQMQDNRVVAVADLHGSLRTKMLSFMHTPMPPTARIDKGPWQRRLAQHLGEHRFASYPTLAARLHAVIEHVAGRRLHRAPLRLVPQDKDLAWAEHTLGTWRHGAQHRPLIVICPSARWASKRWPVAHFNAVAREMARKGAQVLALAGPDEATLAACAVDTIEGALSLTDFDVGGLVGLLAQADAVVANDSAALHIARGLKVPTLALFGSTTPRALEVDDAAALYRQQSCAPCSTYGRKACPLGHVRCLDAIEPQDVLAWLDMALSRQSYAKWRAPC